MPLDIVVYRSGTPWATPKENHFIDGLRLHGIEPEQREAGDIRASDLAVIWSHRDTALFSAQKSGGGHYLVMERGYVGGIDQRRQWTSLGFDGLNGRARFPRAVDNDRWNRNFGSVMKPWKREGDYAVVMGQVRGDASLRNVDIGAWYEEAVSAIKAKWDIPVLFRPHPNDYWIPPALEGQIDKVGFGLLGPTLDRATIVATFNSNSGVDAVLAGVPTITKDIGSMAWPVSSQDYVKRLAPPRTAWAAQLAYCQWTDEEMATGLAWEHLEREM